MIDQEQLISVIVPIYNSIYYFEKCIKSILAQSYGNLEIILIDDGSTDGSGEICDKYANNYSNIVVVHQDNKGLVPARKCGLDIANGDFIGFVDSDDYIDDNMFERLYDEIGSADMIHSGFYENESPYYPVENEIIELNEGSRKKLIEELLLPSDSGNIMPSIWSKLFKKEIIKKVYEKVPNRQSYGEDLLCLMGVYAEANQIKILSEAFYHYNVRLDSMSHNSEDKRILQEIGLFESASTLLKDYELYNAFEKYLVKFLRRQLFHCIRQYFYPDPVQQFMYQGIDTLAGKRIILYGAGDVGKDYRTQLLLKRNIDIVAWADMNYKHLSTSDVISPESIPDYDYDYVLVAVLNRDRATGIIGDLKNLGIDEKKILWSPPVDMLGRQNGSKELSKA